MADQILRLPAKAIRTLVSELCGLQDRVRSGELLEIPAVTLLMESGHSLVGMVIQAAKSGSDAALLLQHQDNSMNVSYVPIDSICGITVHYSSQNLHLLSAGQIKLVSGKIPARLDLERKAQYISEKLAGIAITIAWDEFPRSDEARQSLDLILVDLDTVMISIRSDELGKTTLQQQVEQIEVRVGTKAEVRLQAPVLTIYVSIQFQDLLYLAKNDLQQAIEKIL
jgi:hypothetical protein